MKLIGYELWKIGTKRLIQWFIPLLLIGNAWLFYYEQWRTHPDILAYKDEYMLLVNQLSPLPHEQAAGMIVGKQTQLQALSMISDQNNSNAALQVLVDNLIKEHPELAETLQNNPYRNNKDQLSRDLFLAHLISEQYHAILEYDSFLAGIQQRADELLKVSIFQDEASFSYRNIRRTPEDFQHLRNIPLKPGPDDGIVAVSQFHAADMLSAAAVFLLCMYLFLYEKETDVLRLTRTTARGRLPVIAAKITVLIGLTVVLSVLFYGSITLIAHQLYGFGDLSRYIQSMAAFQPSNLLLTVGQYLAVHFLTQTVALVLLALIIGAMSILFDRAGSVYLCVAGFLGISGVAYLSIHPLSVINYLKFINLFSYFDGYRLLGEYWNINIFGYPVNRLRVSAISTGILLIVLIMTTVWLYTQRCVSESKMIPGLWRRLRLTLRRMFKVRYSIRILSHELFKTMFSAKGYLTVVITVAIGFYSLELQEIRLDHDDAVYNRYMMGLSGEFTQQKMDDIMAEQVKIADIPMEIAQNHGDYEAGKISYSEYLIRDGELNAYALRNQAFERVMDQAEHLQGLNHHAGIHGSFVNELASDYLFDNGFRDRLNALLYATLLLLILSPVMPSDYRNGMILLVRSTKKGKLPLFAHKHATGFLIAIVLMGILYAPVYINLIKHYDLAEWDAPIQSIILFKEVELSLSIFEFVVLVNVLQLLGAFIMTICILFISVITQKQSFTLIAGSVLFVCPIVFQFVGLDFMLQFSFNKNFLLYAVFAEDGSFGPVLLYNVLLILIGICAGYLAWRKYCNVPLAWRRRRIDESFGASRKQGLS